jgi:hypothetical protein
MNKNFASAPMKLAAVLSYALLAGCASPPPRPSGAIVPMEGGRYQSAVKSGDSQAALKTFTRDAEITCTKGETKTRMPWEAQPAPPKYTVVTQTVKDKEGKEIKSSDNKMLDAGISIFTRKHGLESKDSVEVTTIFKCD